ncbi:MAG: c-type cytochrome [Chthoniobacterales bacterium]
MNARLVIGFALLAASVLLLDGCESTPAIAPPVTASFLRAGLRQHADGPTLAEGRRLYLNRCIQCHALPHVTKYDPERLTAIVAKMAGRANLSEQQHDAVLKYLLTTRAQ